MKRVRKKGLEPLRPFGHQLLRLARLPIPPLPQGEVSISSRVALDAQDDALTTVNRLRWRMQNAGKIFSAAKIRCLRKGHSA